MWSIVWVSVFSRHVNKGRLSTGKQENVSSITHAILVFILWEMNVLFFLKIAWDLIHIKVVNSAKMDLCQNGVSVQRPRRLWAFLKNLLKVQMYLRVLLKILSRIYFSGIVWFKTGLTWFAVNAIQAGILFQALLCAFEDWMIKSIYLINISW